MNEARPPRLRDVAELAAVSITTVSHVLNGTRHVANDTRFRVERALETLGYDSNTASRRLPRSKGALGLSLTGASNPFFSELIHGIEMEASRAGLAIFLSGHGDDPTQQQRSVSTLLAHNVEGLVVVPSPGWENYTVPLLRRQQVPFVLVDRMSDVRCDQVATENESATAALVEHLVDLGHKRIAMLRGLDGLSTTQERLHAYRKTLQTHSLPEDDSLVAEGHSTIPGGRAAMRGLLDRSDPPTAVFSGNNAMTIGALQAIKEQGVHIPRDLALVTFDDFEWASAVTPALTAAAQPFHAMGAHAVQLLLRRIRDPMAPKRIVRLPAEIEHRESCGCPGPLQLRAPARAP